MHIIISFNNKCWEGRVEGAIKIIASKTNLVYLGTIL